MVMSAHISLNIFICFKKKTTQNTRQYSKIYLTPPLLQVRTASTLLQGRGSRGNFPRGAGGNVSGGRNTEIGKDLKDGYASAVRLAES